MFDGSLPEIADLGSVSDAAVVDSVAGWARVEAAAAARKSAAVAELFCRRTGLESAQERDDWWADPQASVIAEVGAVLGVRQGLAQCEAHCAVALRDVLPRVAALFAEGAISALLVRTIVARTSLITDAEAAAAVDARLGEEVTYWGRLSEKKLEAAIDRIIEGIDPGGLRRTRGSMRSRHVDFGNPKDEPGYTSMVARLYAQDATVVERRVQELASSVCERDPRDLSERRADALAAMACGLQVLVCDCASADCEAARRSPAAPVTTVIHIVADHATLDGVGSGEPDEPPPDEPPPDEPPPDDEDPTSDDGAQADAASDADAAKPSGQPECAEDPDPAPNPEPAAQGHGPLGYLMGGGVLPAAHVAELAPRAVIRVIRHPGNAPPEDRYVPSTALAEFVRARDLHCRWHGCDKPADICDIDHTVPYPLGPTHASNLKCLCRLHHLLKTFWCGPTGWRDRQLSDGTVIWTAPTGHTYTTHPGSRLLFPALCAPTATLTLPDAGEIAAPLNRGLAMPKRRRTRAKDRAYRIAAERRLNDDLVAEHNKPPPF